MAARVLLGLVAALRAVLIPGEAAFMLDRPLSWPRPGLASRVAAAADAGEIAVKAPAA